MVASTLLCYCNKNGDGDGGEEPMSTTTPRKGPDASRKKTPQHETDCDIGSSMICKLMLMLAGRKLEDFQRHYIEALKTTRLALAYLEIAKTHTARLVEKCVDRQMVRSRDDEETDDEKPTNNNLLDPRMHSILVRILDCLTRWIVHIGVWTGERLPTSFVMAIQGPVATTQHAAGLDSGASQNLISRRSALAAGLSVEPYKGPLLDAIGISIRPVGWVTFTWCVSNFDTVWYTTTFAVLEDGHCKGFNILLSKEEIDKRRFYIRNRGVFFIQTKSNSL
ncbi:MAG: hypothetical protein Q9208_003563 [Pyrenodesmia sp. 3 TL-2023]